jgi:hypothetical protein
MNKLQQLSAARYAAYKHVIDVANTVLPIHDPYAYAQIQEAFQAYECADKRQDQYIIRYAKQYCHALQAVLTCKTITDVYWALPAAMKQLWDAIPELKAWKDKYR